MKIALKVKAQNSVLQKFLSDNNWTQMQLANELNVHYVSLNKYINFKQVPHKRKIIDKFEKLLKMPIDMIFPPILNTSEFKKKFSKTKIKHFIVTDDMIEYSDDKLIDFNNSEEIIQDYEKIEFFKEIIEKLPPRTKFVIDKNFGLTEGIEWTYEKIGKTIGVNKERVRQIKLDALKKIRYEFFKQGKE
jgi:RNA polymerase sigma factor (sigma-70 family)